jgi:mRNA interferase RelE/StbE
VRIAFEASFARDLKRVKDKQLLRRVEQVIGEIKAATELSDIKRLSKLKGYDTFYRIRLGDYRIGLEVLEDEVILVRILHRKDIYRYFPKERPRESRTQCSCQHATPRGAEEPPPTPMDIALGYEASCSLCPREKLRRETFA